MWKLKKRNLTKVRIGIFFSIICSLLAIFLCVVFLMNHLLQIQIPERLRYIKDYQDFTITIDKVSDCTNQIYNLFQLENEIYNGLCIKNVNVNYGSVKAPLELVLKEKYITWKDIQKKLSNISKENSKTSHYEYRRSEEENGNYRVTVAPKEYQNTTINEITFEEFKEEEKEEPKDITMSGELEIN